jgi:hypothetical protein
MTCRIIIVCLGALLSACGSAGEVAGDPDSGSNDVQADTTIGVEEEPKDLLSVISVINFTREIEDGVAVGFDVDGVVSEDGDDESCGHADFVSPDGTKGIDNQLALITPLFDTVGIGAVEGFVQAAVEQGGLLIMWEVKGVDDTQNDDEVLVRLRFGTGKPLLGTDGLLLSGQTFHINPDSPEREVKGSIVDGQLRTEVFEAVLPIVVFEVAYELIIYEARMTADVSYDGGLVNGILGGRVTIENLLTIAERAELEAGGIYEAVTFLLDGMADMSPNEDGECQDLSAALTFTSVSGFLFPDDVATPE